MGSTGMFLGGLALGYVLGTKAGQERYEAIRQTSQRLMENPSVQEAAGVLQAQAIGYADTARKKLNDAMDGGLGDMVPPQVRTVVQGTDGNHAATRSNQARGV